MANFVFKEWTSAAAESVNDLPNPNVYWKIAVVSKELNEKDHSEKSYADLFLGSDNIYVKGSSATTATMFDLVASITGVSAVSDTDNSTDIVAPYIDLFNVVGDPASPTKTIVTDKDAYGAVIWKEAGSPAVQTLVCYLDFGGKVKPNNQDFRIIFSGGDTQTNATPGVILKYKGV